MTRGRIRQIESKDRGLRLIVGIILLSIGLSSFGMMGWGMMGYGMFGSFGYLTSVLLIILGGYLIYEGVKKD